MNFSSKLLENAVNEFSSLPGIGQKTALRLVLHLLNQPQSEVEKFSNSLLILKRDIRYCLECHNISDQEICELCSSVKRDKSLICVVEDTRDVMAIENTGQYQGGYHDIR
jgi:recombination protein RecR